MRHTDEACSNFLPADLTSAKNKMLLVNGASLAPEKLIFTDTMFAKDQRKLKRA